MPKQKTTAYGPNLVGVALVLFLLCSQLGRLLGSGLLAFFYGAAPSAAAEGLYGFLLLLFSFLPPLWFLWRFMRRAWFPLQRPRKPWPLWLMLLLFLSGMAAAQILNSTLLQVCTALFHLPPASEAALPTGLAGWAFYFGTTCLAAPLLEEAFFRGAIQGVLRPYGPRAALLVTAVLFTLTHARPREWLAIFILSLLLGLAAELSGSLLPCICMHMANNGISFFLLLWKAHAGEQRFSPVLVLNILFLLLGFVATLVYMRRRAFWQRPPRQWAPSTGQGLVRLFRCPLFAVGYLGACLFFVLQMIF